MLPLLILLFLGGGCVNKNGAGKINLEEMVRIPAGEFIMGSNDIDKEMLQQRFGMRIVPFQNEHPEHRVSLPEYYIDRYEVTNEKYKMFLDAMPEKYQRWPEEWKNENYPDGHGRHPVRFVTWRYAQGYCNWRGKRLPSEAEWEKAARGENGLRFPWGDEFNKKKGNMLGQRSSTAPVGSYPEDISPYGVYDLGGNASEWVDDWYKSYPGNKFQDELYGHKYKVVRGGNWGGVGHYDIDIFYRSSYRKFNHPETFYNTIGFRCAYSKTDLPDPLRSRTDADNATQKTNLSRSSSGGR